MPGMLGLKEVRTPGRRIMQLFATAQLDASGQAVSSLVGDGVVSMSRSSAGVYVLTLKDTAVRLMYAHVTVEAAGVTPAGDGGNWKVNADTVSSTKTITLMNETFASPGVAVDPQNSAKLLIMVVHDQGTLA